jgi:hypothetical protein
MVDLHHVVARDKYMSNTHVATAGGFVLAAVLAILVHGFGLHNRILGYACCCHGADVRRCALRLQTPRQPAEPFVQRPVDAPAEKPGVLGELLPGDLPVAGILPEGFGGWVLAALLGVGAVGRASCSSA